MSMKRVRELIEQLEADSDRQTGYRSDLADLYSEIAVELRKAIAPDWKPASEPPDDDRQVWVLSKRLGQRKGYWSHFDKEFREQDCELPIKDATHWQEIEVPEPPEVKQ